MAGFFREVDLEAAWRNRYREVDMEAARQAWRMRYVVPQKVMNFVADKLQDYAAKWNYYERYYAPLAALVQSSGWGKSRLMCELWRKDFFVFYVSCMGEKQSGFPRRTEKLADILQSPKSTEATLVALVLSILQVLNKQLVLNMTCEKWMQQQQDSNIIQDEVYALYEQNKESIAKYGRQEQFGKCLKDEIVNLEQRGVKLILCIDEARELHENIGKFMRALGCIPRGESFFSVVLGTDRKIADLAEEDARWATSFKLYHPLYLIGDSDLFVGTGTSISGAALSSSGVVTTSSEAGSSSSGAVTTSSEAGTSSSEARISGKTDSRTNPEHVIRYGRPLWAAYHDSVNEANKIAAVTQLAKMKVLCRNVNTAEPGWVTRDVAVAVFACTVGLDVVAWGSLPQDLVAKHMRTIVKISEDRRRLYTAAAVEPALAAGAAALLHADFLGDFLDKLMEVFVDGLVLEGVRGEVVVKIILLLAMHECTKYRYYIQPVTCSTFLETMFGSTIVKELENNGCSLKESLFFNSFTATTVEPFKELIDAAYDRCTALVTRRNECVLDFALPCSDGSGLPVRAKNRRGQQSMMKTPTQDLQQEDRVNAPVSLLFHIGHRGKPYVRVEHDTVVVYGLDGFEHLKSRDMKKSKVLEKLKLLSRTCEEVFKDASAEEEAILEGMIPMGYVPSSFVGEAMEEKDCKEKGKTEEHKMTKEDIPRILWTAARKRTKRRFD